MDSFSFSLGVVDVDEDDVDEDDVDVDADDVDVVDRPAIRCTWTCRGCVWTAAAATSDAVGATKRRRRRRRCSKTSTRTPATTPSTAPATTTAAPATPIRCATNPTTCTSSTIKVSGPRRSLAARPTNREDVFRAASSLPGCHDALFWGRGGGGRLRLSLALDDVIIVFPGPGLVSEALIGRVSTLSRQKNRRLFFCDGLRPSFLFCARPRARNGLPRR